MQALRAWPGAVHTTRHVMSCPPSTHSAHTSTHTQAKCMRPRLSPTPFLLHGMGRGEGFTAWCEADKGHKARANWRAPAGNGVVRALVEEAESAQ